MTRSSGIPWAVVIPALSLFGSAMQTGSAGGYSLAVLAILSIVFAIRGSTGPLWIAAIVSLFYSALIIFGSGFSPVLASTLLVLAVAARHVRARRRAYSK